MAIIISKLRDNRTLAQTHAKLMNDIITYADMIHPDMEPEEDLMMAVWPDGTTCELSEVHEYSYMSDDYEVIPEQTLFQRHLESMGQKLGNLEEVMSLKWDVDCDCFYR